MGKQAKIVIITGIFSIVTALITSFTTIAVTLIPRLIQTEADVSDVQDKAEEAKLLAESAFNSTGAVLIKPEILDQDNYVAASFDLTGYENRVALVMVSGVGRTGNDADKKELLKTSILINDSEVARSIDYRTAENKVDNESFGSSCTHAFIIKDNPKLTASIHSRTTNLDFYPRFSCLILPEENE